MSNMAVYSPRYGQAESEKRVSRGQWDKSCFFRFGVRQQKVIQVTVQGAPIRGWHGKDQAP